MKIKTKKLSFDEVMALPSDKRRKPLKPKRLFRLLFKTLSAGELKKCGFTCKKHNMDRLGKNEPCLILMNHSSFIDLKIAATVLYPRPFNIVCTSDGFVGKEGLMRHMGCIPAKKFITDMPLFRDMSYAVKKLKSSVLMYPEASYSFDGTATPLPSSLGKCIKSLSVPVVLIRTHGAFAYDPLYNGLQLRNVKVSAEMEYLLSPDEIGDMTAEEINEILAEKFTFDNFRWQQQNEIKISEGFRADGLNRVLYKCPHCLAEGKMKGHGHEIFCEGCGKRYELTELGYIKAANGETEFSHIPDWYSWQRECVKKELVEDTYRLEADVVIRMLTGTKCVYEIGNGHLTHTAGGFHLVGENGKPDFTLKPLSSYSLYADYFWYEIGDMVCIGDDNALYYCFPKDGRDIAAKARLATEELYKLKKQRRTAKRAAANTIK